MLNDRWTFVHLKSFLISFLGGHPLLLGLIIWEHIHSTETIWNCRSTPLTLEACSRETANIIDCELWMSSAPSLLSTTLRTKPLSWWKILWVMLQRLVHSAQLWCLEYVLKLFTHQLLWHSWLELIFCLSTGEWHRHGELTRQRTSTRSELARGFHEKRILLSGQCLQDPLKS